MSRNRVCSIFLLLAASLGLCLSLTAKELKGIALEEVLSLGSLDDDAIFQWTGIAVDSFSNIYVADAMDYSLKKFSPDGRLLKKGGGRGQGPGEFMAPRLLDCSDEYLYATDQSSLGLQVFDRELNFKGRILLKVPVSDLKVLSDSRIAVASLYVDKIPMIRIFDDRGERVQEKPYAEKKMPPMMDSVSFDLDDEGNLYVAYTFQDRVEKFDSQGNKLWSVRPLGTKRVKRKKISSYVLPTEIMFKDVALDERGNLLVLGGHLSKNRSRDVYVISPGGKLLTIFTLPDASHCIYIDHRNFLYSRANEGVTLKKFRMHYLFD